MRINLRKSTKFLRVVGGATKVDLAISGPLKMDFVAHYLVTKWALVLRSNHALVDFASIHFFLISNLFVSYYKY